MSSGMKIKTEDMLILDEANIEYTVWDPQAIIEGRSEVEVEFDSRFRMEMAWELIKSKKEQVLGNLGKEGVGSGGHTG